MSRSDLNRDRDGDWRYLDPDDLDEFERIKRSSDHAMPASSQRKSKNASRKTDGSRRASKRVAKEIGGMNRRRSKRIT